MGITSTYCGIKADCITCDDKAHVHFDEDRTGLNTNENNKNSNYTNFNTSSIDTVQTEIPKSGKYHYFDNKTNQFPDCHDKMMDMGEIKTNPDFLLNVRDLDFQKIKNFDDNLKKIAEYVNDSELDDILRNHLKESEEILESFKAQKIYVSKIPVGTLEKPLLKLFFDGSYYKGEWSIDIKRNGYGISITPDGSRYQGSWLNDSIHGYGRFTSINGNYYEGILLFNKNY